MPHAVHMLLSCSVTSGSGAASLSCTRWTPNTSACRLQGPATWQHEAAYNTLLLLVRCTAGLQDMLITLVSSPGPTTTTATATTALPSPAPVQQEQTTWCRDADLNTILQLQLSVAAAKHDAPAHATAATAALGPMQFSWPNSQLQQLTGHVQHGPAPPSPGPCAGERQLQHTAAAPTAAAPAV
mgnify:CR=1 FL=1